MLNVPQDAPEVHELPGRPSQVKTIETNMFPDDKFSFVFCVIFVFSSILIFSERYVFASAIIVQTISLLLCWKMNRKFLTTLFSMGLLTAVLVVLIKYFNN